MRNLSLIIFALFSFFFATITPAASTQSMSEVISWQPYSESIFSQAKAKNLPIFLYAKATWCHFCQDTDAITFRDAGVISIINKNFIPVMLDIDKNKAVAAVYGVTKLPTFFVLNSKNQTLREIQGYTTPKALVAKLEQVTGG